MIQSLESQEVKINYHGCPLHARRHFEFQNRQSSSIIFIETDNFSIFIKTFVSEMK